ncbi:ComEC/Rec2 family competence protein [Candidatus Omnitrophota bacterium]
MKIKIHRPFIVVAIPFALGVVLSGVMDSSFRMAVLFVCLLLFSSFIFKRIRLLSTVFLLGAIMSCGFLYTQARNSLASDHLSHVAKYYPRKLVLIEGVIVSDVEERSSFKGKKTMFHLQVTRLKTKWGWKEKSGKLLVNLFRESDLSYGDVIIIEGRLHQPFEFSKSDTFSYRDLLARKGIRHILSVKARGRVEVIRRGEGFVLKQLSLKAKRRFKNVLNETLSMNEAAIMRAILLGDRHDIPKHVRELFQLSGVAHVLAISGLHIGIVSFLFFMLLKMLPISRRWQYGLTVLLLLFYALLTGGRTSVVRATIMASVFISSFILERETDVFNVLSFAALVILLLNPNNLFDVGFQLSFLSVFSIIVFYPRISKLLKQLMRHHKSRGIAYLIQSISVSSAAYLGVLGLIAYYFQIITPISVFANIIIIPLIAVIVSLGMGLMIVAFTIPTAVVAFAVCIKLLLNAMVVCIFLFTKVPGAYVLIRGISVKVVILYYCGLGALILGGFFLEKRARSPDLQK